MMGATYKELLHKWERISAAGMSVGDLDQLINFQCDAEEALTLEVINVEKERDALAEDAGRVSGIRQDLQRTIDKLQRFEEQDRKIRTAHGWKRDGRELPKIVKDATDVASLSEVPCCCCGGSVMEFSISNESWNTIIRDDGSETDQEYLCLQCFAEIAAHKICDNRAIISKLPKCWRLVDGKLMQDCPVVPGMKVYFLWNASKIGHINVDGVEDWGGKGVTRLVRGYGNHGKCKPDCECYNSLEAAKFAQEPAEKVDVREKTKEISE